MELALFDRLPELTFPLLIVKLGHISRHCLVASRLLPFCSGSLHHRRSRDITPCNLEIPANIPISNISQRGMQYRPFTIQTAFILKERCNSQKHVCKDGPREQSYPLRAVVFNAYIHAAESPGDGFYVYEATAGFRRLSIMIYGVERFHDR